MRKGAEFFGLKTQLQRGSESVRRRHKKLAAVRAKLSARAAKVSSSITVLNKSREEVVFLRQLLQIMLIGLLLVM